MNKEFTKLIAALNMFHFFFLNSHAAPLRLGKITPDTGKKRRYNPSRARIKPKENGQSDPTF